jgi:hypothetical protein
MIFKIPTIKTEDLKDNLRVVVVAYDDDLDITYLIKEDVLGEYKKKEADAELGRAVRKAFYKKRFYMKETGMLKTGIVIETEKDLLEWVKGVEQC